MFLLFLVFHLSMAQWKCSEGYIEIDKISPLGLGGDASMVISGNFAMLGAYHEDTEEGAVYFYDRSNQNGWIFSQKLKASEGAPGDEFGYSVSISGNRAIIGAPSDLPIGSGAVYFFEYNGTSSSWVEKQKIKASDYVQYTWFGYSVSISGNNVIVGAKRGSITECGSAYVFTFNETSQLWEEKQKIMASDSQYHDEFGASVSISSDKHAIVGAHRIGSSDEGAAYHYMYNGSFWEEKQKIIGSDVSTGDYFGSSVFLSGNYAIIGAEQSDFVSSNAGSAYIFFFNGSSWEQKQKLEASDGKRNDEFGVSVSMSESGEYIIVVSKILLLLNKKGTRRGGAYIFRFDGNTWGELIPGGDSWVETQKLNISDGSSGDEFLSVAISDSYAFVGSNVSVYVFSNEGPCKTKCEDGNLFWSSSEPCCKHDVDSTWCMPYCTLEYCIDWECDEIPWYDDNVCHSSGICVAPDSCDCGDYLGENCDEWACGGLRPDQVDVCSRGGTCTAPNTCDCVDGHEGALCEICLEGYEGEFCEYWYCGEHLFNSTALVCSGSGTCVGPGMCNCDSGFSGWICQSNVAREALIPLLISLCVAIGLVVLLCFVVMVLVVFMFVRSRKKLQRFEKVDGIELIVAESELEEKTGMNKVKISKSMMSIESSELKKKKRLTGGGGDASGIFVCEYQRRDVVCKEWSVSLTEEVSEFEQEVRLMSGIQHPNIVQFYGFCIKPSSVAIVMELGELGTLKQFLNTCKEQNKEPTFREKVDLLKQITSAVVYLHSKQVIHRDLKPENVIMCSPKLPKLLDFGLSRTIEKLDRTKTFQVGTNIFMSPEICLGVDYDYRADVFSLSIMAFCILTLQWNPFQSFRSTRDRGLIEMSIANDPNCRPNMEDLDQKWMRELLKQGWEHDQNRRLTSQQFLDILKKSDETKKIVFLKLHSQSNEDGVDVEVPETIQELRQKTWREFDKEFEFSFHVERGQNNVVLTDANLETLKDDDVIVVMQVGALLGQRK